MPCWRGDDGDGHIDFATITSWVRDAGYTGDIEVEIFNADIWATPVTRCWPPWRSAIWSSSSRTPDGGAASAQPRRQAW